MVSNRRHERVVIEEGGSDGLTWQERFLRFPPRLFKKRQRQTDREKVVINLDIYETDGVPDHVIASSENMTLSQLMGWARMRWPLAKLAPWNVGWPWCGVSVILSGDLTERGSNMAEGEDDVQG